MASIDWPDVDKDFIRDHPEMSNRELREHFGSKHSEDSIRSQRRRLTENADVEDRLTRLGRISDLLEKSGIPLEEIGKVERVRLNDWQGFYKDKEGEAHTVDMEAASIILVPKWAEGPKWPVVQPASPVSIKPAFSYKKSSKLKTTVILPDIQIGYFRTPDDNLHPTHDERCLSIALSVCRDVQPEQIILIGDNLDFPELSRYRKQPAFVRTTQATIDRTARFIAELRNSVPAKTTIEWIEGNHERRLGDYIKDNAAAAFGLKRGALPASWPVLSVPVLCNLDSFAVNYRAGYPAVAIWLNDRLKVVHGDKATKGSNAYAYLDEERASTIYGHTHRREWAERTRESRYGPRTIMAASPGCLCRIDGVVPSANSGTDLDGTPLESWQDWQQGLAVASYTPEDGPFSYEPIPIHHGEAYYRGAHYVAKCDVEGK